MLLWLLLDGVAQAQSLAPDATQVVADLVGDDPSAGMSTSVRLLLFLTGLTFLPALIVVMTPFVRFVVVLSLLRQALGLQQSPPNQVIIGVSLILTMLVMQPVLQESWAMGVGPFMDGQMELSPAIDAVMEPWREFMLANTRRAEMAAILDIAQIERPETLEEIPTTAVISSYVLSELGTAFVIAVYVFIPFLVVDIIVSSILLGMGMMMLPPPLVSLPFKLLVFVLMDGWVLLIQDLAGGIAR